MPPFSMKERYGRGIEKIGSSLPPLGLLYVGAALEKEGYHVKVFDTQIQDWDIKEAGNSDIAGIYCNTSNYHKAIELAKEIKANFHIPIVFGGPHVTTRPLEVLENGSVDYVVVGEGEISAVELLRSIDNPETVKGIGFKKNGKAIINPGRELIKNLDSLPLPARHLIPIGQYKPSPNQYKRLPMTTMMVSRGCPFNCTFCDVETLWTRLYRSRSVNNVISEIKRLIKDYGIKEINFWDDVWGINKAWIDDFCSQILNEKIDITWSCECRVDTVDGELLKKMKKAGCWCIFFGIESLDQEILDAINKIQEYIKGMDYEGFRVSNLVQDGVIRQLEIIGEAAKNLSQDFREKHPYIPWKDMAGMRDKLIHQYFGVDIAGVWDTAEQDIPTLKSNLIKLL